VTSGARLPLISPMLATLGTLPTADGWASEFKWDGVRTVAYLDGGAVRAMSRNDLDVSSQYPEIGALSGLSERGAVLDGEIVALDDAGVPDFARLQSRMHVKAPAASLLRTTPVTFYLFDVLALNGEATIGLPYQRRREILEDLDLNRAEVRTPPAFLDARPIDVYQVAVDSSLEGVVCKRFGSTYQPGRRSPDWIKVPVAQAQEVIIIGWQPGGGRRSDMIGALLLAAHESQGDLVYVGKVGTGFTDTALRHLAERLGPLARATPPVTDVPREHRREARWVEPSLVGEVAFRNWTPEGRLRHPSWRGLRGDKNPGQVFRG
jgi:bifunctional non-homologous end joining protein LigD